MGSSPHRRPTHSTYKPSPYLKYIIIFGIVAILMLFWSLRPSRHLDFGDESDTGIFSQRKNTKFRLSGEDE